MATSNRFLTFAAAALLLAGCPGKETGDVSQNAPPQTSTTTSNPQFVPENSTAMNPVAPPQKDMPGNRVPAAATAPINVDLIEHQIRMPDRIAAGRPVFAIINHGKENHSFVIEGNGVNVGLTSPLTRGDTGQITVDLAPGTYTVYCPVDGHKGKGMTRTLTVE